MGGFNHGKPIKNIVSDDETIGVRQAYETADIFVKISKAPGNAIVSNGDGIFAETGGGTELEIVSSDNSISIEKNENTDDIGVKISAEDGNGLLLKEDGLYAEQGSSPTPQTVDVKSDVIDIRDMYIDDLEFNYAPIEYYKFAITNYNYQSDVDYSLSENWFVLPATKKHRNDLFVLAPTTVFDETKGGVLDPQDEDYRRGVINFLKTIGAANYLQTHNIYVPKVHQVNGTEYVGIANQEQLIPLFEQHKYSALDSFKYYIENLNGGADVDLIGHSQGSYQIYFIIRDLIATAETEIKDKIRKIVTPGMTLTQAMESQLDRFTWADDKSSYGMFFVWNTVFDNDRESCMTWSTDTQHSINPISWDEDSNFVSRSDNLGAVAPMFDFKNIVRLHGDGCRLINIGTSGQVEKVELTSWDVNDMLTSEQKQFLDSYNLTYGHIYDVGAFAKNIFDMVTYQIEEEG